MIQKIKDFIKTKIQTYAKLLFALAILGILIYGVLNVKITMQQTQHQYQNQSQDQSQNQATIIINNKNINITNATYEIKTLKPKSTKIDSGVFWKNKCFQTPTQLLKEHKPIFGYNTITILGDLRNYNSDCFKYYEIIVTYYDFRPED